MVCTGRLLSLRLGELRFQSTIVREHVHIGLHAHRAREEPWRDTGLPGNPHGLPQAILVDLRRAPCTPSRPGGEVQPGGSRSDVPGPHQAPVLACARWLLGLAWW